MQLLLDAGVDVNAGKNVSPLMAAIEGGTISMVEGLLSHGADLHGVKGNGTALTYAIEAGRPEMVELLLKHGATTKAVLSSEATNRQDWIGLTPLEIARKHKHRKIIEIVETYHSSGAECPPQLQSIEGNWEKCESALSESCQNPDDWYLPPASKSDLELLERFAGYALPHDVWQSWQIHNGQREGAYLLRFPSEWNWLEGEIGLFRLLSTSEFIDEWKRMQASVEAGAFDYTRVDAEAGIQPRIWGSGWLPLARNYPGDLWCLDLVPAEAGIAGQIVLISSESSVRSRMANSSREAMNQIEVVVPKCPKG